QQCVQLTNTNRSRTYPTSDHMIAATQASRLPVFVSHPVFKGQLLIYLASSLVAMAEGNHAYPSRTRPLSLPAPMVLGPQGPGGVGRRKAMQQSSASDRTCD